MQWLLAPLAWLPVLLLVWTERPYLLDLASHFLPHAGAAMIFFGGVLALLRGRILGASSAAAGLVLVLAWMFAVRAPIGGGTPAEGATRLKLVFYNMYGSHSRHDNEFNTWLRDQKPDLVVIVDAAWGYLQDQPWLTREYPYHIEPEPGLLWSNVLLSRFPAEVTPLVEYSEEIKFSFIARRSLLVTLESGARFLLTADHPPSPRTRETWLRSLREIERDGPVVRAWAERVGVPIVMPGDFNSSPQGRVHREFGRLSGLVAWQPMILRGTWPASLPRWMALPIDKVWTSPPGSGVVVRSMVVGPQFRSDHRPLIIELDVAGGSDSPSLSEPSVGGAR